MSSHMFSYWIWKILRTALILSVRNNKLKSCSKLKYPDYYAKMQIQKGIRTKPHCLPHVVMIFSLARAMSCWIALALEKQSLFSLGDFDLFGHLESCYFQNQQNSNSNYIGCWIWVTRWGEAHAGAGIWSTVKVTAQDLGHWLHEGRALSWVTWCNVDPVCISDVQSWQPSNCFQTHLISSDRMCPVRTWGERKTIKPTIKLKTFVSIAFLVHMSFATVAVFMWRKFIVNLYVQHDGAKTRQRLQDLSPHSDL